MDRRTLLAVVLSVIVITIGFSIQSLLFPPVEPVPPADVAERQLTRPVDPDAVAPEDPDAAVEPTGSVVAIPQPGISTQPQIYQNEVIRVTMDPAGATITSFELLHHMDGDEPVNMVLRGDDEQAAMTLHFGNHNAPPVTDLFEFRQIDSTTFEFSRRFTVVGQPDSDFRLVRRYQFVHGEYMFRHQVDIRNEVAATFIPLNFDGIAYTIGYGPQIGPYFEELDQRMEFRRYITYQAGRRQNHTRIARNNVQIVSDRFQWASVAGKYFAVIALPEVTADLTAILARRDYPGLPEGSQIYISRPVIRASAISDTYYYYAGPKIPAVLNRYDARADNAWNHSDSNFREIQETRVLFGWLENILKWMLQTIALVVPNYGLSIIILTVIVKLALWPLTRKSHESNARMQLVQPKMAEIRERYKDNQQKQNEEMAKLYKKEGVNPLGGCLPMLAQFPFFIAMYGLFSNHFDLRGAEFIPGWINDLSAPDVIVSFGGFTIPLIGWTALRGLPIIFVGTQLLSSKLMQTPSTSQSTGQMKLMQLGLPIVFFFILYNVPSGLLVYWIFSNILTVAQQYYYNTMKKNAPPPPKKKPATRPRKRPT
jgi:YidC/Oxa1 family membrane protein insertase